MGARGLCPPPLRALALFREVVIFFFPCLQNPSPIGDNQRLQAGVTVCACPVYKVRADGGVPAQGCRVSLAVVSGSYPFICFLAPCLHGAFLV